MSDAWWLNSDPAQIVTNARMELVRLRHESNLVAVFAEACRVFEQVTGARLGIPLETDEESRKKTTLKALIDDNTEYWGARLWDDLDFARRTRNRFVHRTFRGRPPDEEINRAAGYFLESIELQLDRMTQENPAAFSNGASAGDKEQVRNTSDDDFQRERDKRIAEFIATSPLAKEKDLPWAQTRQEMQALPNDPKLRVATIAECEFCTRAAILSDEDSSGDPDPELSSLERMPWYELDAILERQAENARLLLWLAIILPVATAANYLSPIGNTEYARIVQALVCGAWTYPTFLVFLNWRKLGQRRLAAELAGRRIPNPDSREFQPVNWWELLAADFEVHRVERALVDDEWKISGRPRRILRRGSLAIPVHRISKPSGPLKPQHIVRAMAYCHLLLATEGAHTPYAIIFFRDSYDGITVPNTEKHREMLYAAIKRCRKLIAASKTNESVPPVPVERSCCQRCPHGLAQPITKLSKTMRYGQPLDPYILKLGSQQFNCRCGDRFQWKPPHLKNRRLRAE